MTKGPVEVAPKVFRLTVGQGAFLGVYAPNVYLVVGDDSAVFIDTAYGEDQEIETQLECWRSCGEPSVSVIVLTHRHPDHIGGALRLREATGGAVVATVLEKEPIERALGGAKLTRTVEDNEVLVLGGATLEFVHTPGHTMGSLCVYHRELGLLFTGDTILGKGPVAVSPDEGDMGLYIESLRRLLDFDARMICPGHGPEVHWPRAKIRELIDHRLDRERQILELLRGGRGTVEELLGTIYPELDSRLHEMARGQIHAHLLKLQQEGRTATCLEKW